MKSNPKHIFLLDGLGAMLSFFIHGIVLVKLEVYIGMPINVLYSLAFLASIFMIYSLSCYFFNPKNWSIFLQVVIALNISYNFLTCGLLIYFYHQLSFWGVLYFHLEIAVISVLVMYEMYCLNKDKINH